jgi:amino-acid N-acetyltransferase
MHARKAVLPDASAIHGLIFEYARHGTLLPRSLTEIYENIRDFTVVENRGRVIGCGAMHIYGMHMAEARSIAVWPLYRGRGAGRILMKALLEEARQHHIACICLFTRIPRFFGHLGFTKVKKERLPDKLYKDCRNCRNRGACDEVAMIRGRLPKPVTLEAEPEKRAPRRKGTKK